MRPLCIVPAVCALAMAACVPRLAEAPASPSDDRYFVGETPAPAPGLSSDPTEPDTLVPGDVIALRVISSLSMSSATEIGAANLESPHVEIDRNGFAHLPLVGDVGVGGKTIVEAERAVQEQVSRYDRYSRIALMLVEARGHFASVTGAVEHPGNVPLIGDARVADVLASAGGPKALSVVADARIFDMGDLGAARLLRNGHALPIDFRQAVQGDPHHNIRVRPGDMIAVPASAEKRVTVLGQVVKPRSMPYAEAYRLMTAIADAGGFTQVADYEDVRVIRGGFGNPRIYLANAKDILAGRRPNILLASGDVVFVTEHWFGTVGDVLNRLAPALAATYVADLLVHQ